MQHRKSEPSSASLKALLNAYERQLIQSALAATAGNQRRAAAALGLLPTTLHEKMKRLGLLRRPRREDEDREPEREREEELLAEA
jgi:two-component system response regulator HydG